MPLLHWLERSGGALMRLAPARYRAAWQTDLVSTFRTACLAAHRERGWTGLVFAGITELGSIGSSAVKVRFGGGPAISAGGPRQDDERRRRASLGLVLANDLRLAFRSILGNKMTVGIAIATLALGIGVNAAVFSILDSVIIRPNPFANADRLDEVWSVDPKHGFSFPRMEMPVLRQWRAQSDIFDRVEAYEMSTSVYQSARGAEMLTGAIVTPGMMSMLGAPPLFGRTLVDGDGRGGTDTLVVVSERFWREELQRDSKAIGRTLTLNGVVHTIVGVMPAVFSFPNDRARFWTPYDVEQPPPDRVVKPSSLVAFARRRADVTPEAAAAAVTERGEALSRAAGVTRIYSAQLRGRMAGVDTRTRRSLYVLGGAVAFLLLIVCANVANLSLSRTLIRTKDLAVRASLGASRRDLVRETLIENMIIGGAGALLGLVVAGATLALVVSSMPLGFSVSSMNAIDLDGRALAFAAAIGMLTPLCFGLAPALLASRANVLETLKGESRSTTGSVVARRLRATLVVAEVTLAIVLLAGAALMARSFVKLQNVDRGFDTAGLIAVRVGMPAVGYLDPYDRDAFVDRMLARVRTLPGIIAASAGAVPPENSMISLGKLEMSAAPQAPTENLILPIYLAWPNYFEATGIPLRAGRAFAENEPRESTIVSESFATKYFPGGAVGGQFRFQGAKVWRTIVGVAGEVRQLDLDDSTGSFEFYYPLRRPAGMPAPPPSDRTDGVVEYRTILARVVDPDASLARLRQAVHDVDPRVVISEVLPVEQAFADAIARPRLILLMLAVFGGVGLILAMAGIYGVLSYGVAQRRREIGIRLALGARPELIGRLILRHGLTLTVVGLVLGTALALALVRVMRSMLYEVEPSDPASMLMVATLLLATAVVASWRPARQAMRVDPVALLRE